MGSLVWFDRIVLILGLWLVLAAFILPMPDGVTGAPGLNSLLTGLLLVLFSGAAIVLGGRWQDWLNLLLGIWLILAPWVLGYLEVPVAAWVHTILGLIVAAISLFAIVQKARMGKVFER
ncbi:hypothetical protein CAI21_10385 [Alkalilimnicola ehrlichii]|uniref:SPW repeat-containing integral membrane domain-containing protein n=1 Tax=Alkalilimnicola ehrlichii TaxID=351052 RepID=A0A3E0WV88_9GAMM|nr:SPW repeat protein [Alkalilimnicola ehrlichii]RFA29168.1 hypothetical protein CAI21_10385 [Alkalilimnicola ehrlichii]RFA36081.1 hypothetical protein CAL65_11535 [Alkalilimnicola ehrlichii]